jgi:hypothetical protein
MIESHVRDFRTGHVAPWVHNAEMPVHSAGCQHETLFTRYPGILNMPHYCIGHAANHSRLQSPCALQKLSTDNEQAPYLVAPTRFFLDSQFHGIFTIFPQR